MEDASAPLTRSSRLRRSVAYAVGVPAYAAEDAAARAGVEPAYLVRLVDLDILAPQNGDRFSPGDLRRAMMARSLENAGIPLDGVAAGIRRGALSLDFLDAAAYERFAALAPETFRQVSERTGVPVELLMVIREAIGRAQPSDRGPYVNAMGSGGVASPRGSAWRWTTRQPPSSRLRTLVVLRMPSENSLLPASFALKRWSSTRYVKSPLTCRATVSFAMNSPSR